MGYIVTGATQGGWGRARTVETLLEAESVAADMRSGYDGKCSDSRVRIYRGHESQDGNHLRAWRGGPGGWHEVF